MGFIGVQPTSAPLTSSDITDGVVSQSKISSEAVNESKIQVSNSPTNGYFLSAQSGNTGGLTWAEAGLSGWSVNSGNLLPSDASKGIYLGVNSATASNLLTDYEEGEVTNALEIGSTQVTGYSSGRSNAMYVKIGKTVHMQFYLDTQGNTLPTTGQCFVRLPFAVRSSSTNCFPTGVAFGSGTNSATSPTNMKGEFYLNSGNTKTGITKYDDSTTFNANSTGDRIILQGAFTYQVD